MVNHRQTEEEEEKNKTSGGEIDCLQPVEEIKAQRICQGWWFNSQMKSSAAVSQLRLICLISDTFQITGC